MTWVTPMPTSASAGVPADEIRNGDRQRRDIALGHVHARLPERMMLRHSRSGTPAAIPDRICRRPRRNGSRSFVGHCCFHFVSLLSGNAPLKSFVS